MRKLTLGLLVPLLTFGYLSNANADEMTGKGAAASAALQRLEVTHSHDGLSVEFRAKGMLTPRLSTLDSPARIVVDFPNTVMATSQSLISVGQDGVKELRIGMDGQVPPHTRVVVDLTSAAAGRQHELVSRPDGSFVLNVHDAAVTRLRPASAPAATQLAPASALQQLVAASTAANSASAPSPAASSAASPVSSPITSPSSSNSAPEVGAAPAVAAGADSPSGFAFIEPKYSVKENKAEDKASDNNHPSMRPPPRRRKRPVASPIKRRPNWSPAT